MQVLDLDPATAHAELGNDPEILVLDVRTPHEYAAYRIAGATSIPVHELPHRVGELDPGRAYLVVCEHGIRSMLACEILANHGFGDVRNLTGGMAQWVAAGLAHVSGPA